MAATREYTAKMVRRLNDQSNWRWPRYEVVDGELLVTPSPFVPHQMAVQNLVFALGLYLRREPVGTAFTSPADLSWGPKKLVQPDVFVLSPGQIRSEKWPPYPRLLLAAEVLSRGSKRGDRVVKRQLYQEQGVPTYWIVDPDAHTVEVWTPDARAARVEREMLTWHPAGASAPFSLPFSELFRPPI